MASVGIGGPNSISDFDGSGITDAADHYDDNWNPRPLKPQRADEVLHSPHQRDRIAQYQPPGWRERIQVLDERLQNAAFC